MICVPNWAKGTICHFVKSQKYGYVKYKLDPIEDTASQFVPHKRIIENTAQVASVSHLRATQYVAM